MRDPRVVVAGSDGVVGAVFDGGVTARMSISVQERFTAACDDAIPQEMTCGETTRIDQTALTGLIEKSEGMAVGTPKSGLPVLEMAADEPPVEAAPVEIAVREPSMPVLRHSRARDVLIGGFLSLLVMAAWYCATQL